MQNREELRQKGHDGSRKTKCRERGKKYHFQKGGGGINIVFGPKYRPLGKGEGIVGEEKRQYNKNQHGIGGGGVRLERTIRLELDVVQCV
jgi:hypothetical protein